MRLAKARRMPQLEQLATRLDRLADFEACPFPVISLYLNLQADEHGKDRFEPFLRKELADQIHQRQSGSLKVAGRERPGNAVAKAPKAMAELEEARAQWMEKQAKQPPKKKSNRRAR